ncbi:SDR family NAD(P)-dependent oxidoreductase [Catenuloplanes indicus]|uniref:3-oxoacyl-[acyl-carrier protein] reductase n=1 Tax=Catenuloplanes indicus TaxID=137267 RepID=A0AAE3W756_9ACTN|nr:SDR family oxidoreductase [Catenuloplanes indicus]MDQ0370779.1 3-oxoacyl-[acyl-carrier protein] reductase [Catenuloplanes indicus]
MTDLTGKVAVVTGSARGIGEAIAKRFASLGANVVVNYSTDEENARRTASEIEAAGGRAHVVQADISSLPDIDRLFDETLTTFGSVDIVVANAGREVVGQLAADVTEDDFDRLFSVNAKGAFFTLQKAAKVLTDGGRLISIGSTTTIFPYSGLGLYSSSKVVAAQFVRILALELASRAITVNTILPTGILGAGVFADPAGAEAFRAGDAQMGRIDGRVGTPEDVADAAEYFVGDLAGWVSGQTLTVAGGAIA